MGLTQIRIAPFYLGCGLLVVSAAWAQQAPNAGSVLRGIEQNTPPPPQPSPQPLVPLPSPEEGPALKEGATVHVTGFHIVAINFSEPELQDVVKPWVGRDCTLGDLRDAAAAIGKYYHDHGFLAHAYIPRQDVENGTVTIQVIEAKVGKVVVDPSSDMRFESQSAIDIVAAHLTPGGELSFAEVETGIAALAEQPGLKPTGTLEPGSEAGATDVRLEIEEGPLVTGSVLVDNDASRTLGIWRGVGSLSINDATGDGDQQSVTLVRSGYGGGSASTYVRYEATIGVGTSGLRLGVDGAGTRYQISPSFNITTPSGWTMAGGVEAMFPVWRGDASVWDARASYDHKYLVSQVFGTLPTGISSIDVGTLGIDGTDQLPVIGGTTRLSLGLTVGRLNLSGDPSNQYQDQMTAQTRGLYPGASWSKVKRHRHPFTPSGFHRAPDAVEADAC